MTSDQLINRAQEIMEMGHTNGTKAIVDLCLDYAEYQINDTIEQLKIALRDKV